CEQGASCLHGVVSLLDGECSRYGSGSDQACGLPASIRTAVQVMTSLPCWFLTAICDVTIAGLPVDVGRIPVTSLSAPLGSPPPTGARAFLWTSSMARPVPCTMDCMTKPSMMP